MVDWRPEAEDFPLYGEIVPTEPQEGLVIKSKVSATHDDAWFYVAVLPHQPAETLRSNTEQVNISVDYSFKVFTARCQYWDEVHTEWSTYGCKSVVLIEAPSGTRLISLPQVGDLTSLTKLHCRCQHLSAFGGSFLIPPNKLDPIHDIVFFLTVVDNPVVVSFVSLLLFLYVLLLVWACWKDNKDRKL
ncbi:unnamed protein product, partial [Timema podura]|nr:unnamed protein product [Timema podura]